MKTDLQKFLNNDILPEEFERMLSELDKTSDEELSDIITEDYCRFTAANCAPTRSKSHFGVFMSIAASVLLIICVGLSVRLFRMAASAGNAEVVADAVIKSDGGRSVMALPDGTKVILNSGSVMTYSSDFNKKERKVTLEGEAFFDVVKNSSKTFIVSTVGMEISVHGTKFNVYAYPDMACSEMSLVEGSVSVKSGDTVLEVSPNEKVCIDRCSGRMNLVATDNEVETAWLKKTLVFMHEPLYKVIDKLERRFGMHIDCSDRISLSDIYTGTFKDRNITDILDILKMHYGFDYNIEDTRITITHNN